MASELYFPSRCTAKLPDDLDKEYLVSEPKMDGSRYVMYLGFHQCPYGRNLHENTLLSRRASVTDNKLVDKTANIPHITKQIYEGLDGTVIDGECMAVNFPDTNSIMNSAPPLAIQKQKELGKITYHAFDIIAFRGKDVRGLPLSQRRKLLVEVVNRMDNPNIIVIEQFPDNHIEHFRRIVEEGGEGIIVKDLRQGYGSGWSKYKKSTDVSCIITGWKPGKAGTKYKDTIGALAISVYHEGKLLEVGFASGFSDKIRHEMFKNFDSYEGQIVDIFAQEISKDNRLRHPTFHRFRDDVNPKECTLEKLKADFKKKTMFKRVKE